MAPLAPRFDTLGYADEKGLDVVAKCGRCGHEAEMNLSKLGVHFGWRTLFEQIQVRLRCQKCKAKAATLTGRPPVRVCPTCKRPL